MPEGLSENLDLSEEDINNVDTTTEAYQDAINDVEDSSDYQQRVTELENQKNKAQEPVLEAIARVAGTGPITPEMLADACKDEPETTDGKNLKENFIKPGVDSVNESVENVKNRNREKGDLTKCPKTLTDLLSEWGPALLKLALALAAIGLVKYELDKVAAEMTGCYENAKNTGTSQKISCIQANCSCGNISQCGKYPVCGGSDGVSYVWQKYSAFDALVHLAQGVAQPFTDLAKGVWKDLQQVLIGAAIIAAVLLTLFIIYKVITNKNQGQTRNTLGSEYRYRIA
jgi:hypothetical protein